jgi:uncharacterized membrane protein YGL010W
MQVRDLAIGAAAGLATFLVVTVLVTELAAPAIAFSVLVGLPVGVVAGLTVLVFVALALADETRPRRRHLAVGVGTFGVVFLLVFVVEGIVLGRRPSIALPVATVVGLGFGVLAYVRAR